MKKLNPTIPLDDFRLAVNLDATRAIQNHPKTPAYNCECEACNDWRPHYLQRLPSELIQPMRRIGIALEQPFELYRSVEGSGGWNYRVQFHLVGKCLSGPVNSLVIDDDILQSYKALREKPWLGLRVSKVPVQDEAYYPSPRHAKAGDLLCVDLRFLWPR